MWAPATACLVLAGLTSAFVPPPLSPLAPRPPMQPQAYGTAHIGRLRRRAGTVVAATYANFDDLERDVRAHLATLSEAELNDPDAPSPLAYLQLQAAGRTDLVEGLMNFGGYLVVSEKLGVRTQRAAAVPSVVNAWTQPAEEIPDVGVVLSAQGKEDKMAADLERLAASGGLRASRGAQGTSVRPGAGGDRLTPIPRGVAPAKAGPQSDEMQAGAGRYLRLDGLERANAALLCATLAAAFGQTSSEVLDAAVVDVARLGAAVLVLAHGVIATYGAFAASSAPDESAVGWFAKLSFTGLGGLRELKQQLARSRETE
jgi:hypothetical protein